MAVKKSERLRFTREDDLILLREVISKNPYEENDRWKVITERVGAATGKHFTLRAVREHLELLLKHWIRENRQNLKKSGIEEEYTEKEQLRQEIEDLQKEYHRYQHKSAKKNNLNLQKLGTQARDRALTNIYPSNTTIIQDLNLSPILKSEQEIISVVCSTNISENIMPSSLPCSTSESDKLSKESSSSSLLYATPLSTINSMRRTAVRGGLKNSTLQFLEEKHKKEIEELREIKKLEFEKEKFELEKKERETKLQLDKEERQHNMAAANQQRQLMEMLLHLLNKSKA